MFEGKLLSHLSRGSEGAHLIFSKHPEAPVRQSGYALVGDMAVSCFPLIRPYLPHVMNELVLQLDPEPRLEYVSACNNAAWSVGEVALKYGRGRSIAS